eukprot:CAMPEP_0170492128 /NCGR_PEP_ID=MMETSP0208-20121228/11727_1 /TAXON_ID=197538 /ORGANISM="Strombidium inclinatum, Strain S3" /LENGTH=134 /DNA_ID=CAMNT_0010767823 /DNA_START=659 /DNA_END=1063 /DNA_ORIENTATION=-
MEISQSNQNLGSDCLDSGLRKPLVLDQVVEQVASADVLQEEVDALVVLENIIHGQNEGVFRRKKDVFLRSGVQNLALFNEDVFINTLHSILLVVPSVNYKEDLAEGSFVEHPLNFEVLQAQLGLTIGCDELALG